MDSITSNRSRSRSSNVELHEDKRVTPVPAPVSSLLPTGGKNYISYPDPKSPRSRKEATPDGTFLQVWRCSGCSLGSAFGSSSQRWASEAAFTGYLCKYGQVLAPTCKKRSTAKPFHTADYASSQMRLREYPPVPLVPHDWRLGIEVQSDASPELQNYRNHDSPGLTRRARENLTIFD